MARPLAFVLFTRREQRSNCAAQLLCCHELNNFAQNGARPLASFTGNCVPGDDYHEAKWCIAFEPFPVGENYTLSPPFSK